MHTTPILSSVPMSPPTFGGRDAHVDPVATREIPVPCHAQGEQ